MELKEKKRKLKILKAKNRFKHIVNMLYVHKWYIFFIIITLMLLILSYSFYYNKYSIDEKKSKFVFNLLLSLFTSLSSGFVLFLFLNWKSKDFRKISPLKIHVDKIEDKVFELQKIICLIINNEENDMYNRFNGKILTWFVDFGSIRSVVFYSENKNYFQELSKIIDSVFILLKDEYFNKVVDDKTLMNFCKKYEAITVNWLNNISNYKTLIQDQLNIIDKSIFTD